MLDDGLELLLEALPGSVFPPDCFAAVRSGGDSAVAERPTRCVPHEASCLGKASSRLKAPLEVDIFQKIGSISLERLYAGACSESSMMLPNGGTALSIRLAVVDVQVAAAQAAAVAAQAAQAAAASKTPPAAAPAATQEPVPPQSPPATPSQEVPFVRQTSRQSSPNARNRNEDDVAKLYKPISLNNCDQIIPHLYLGGVAAVADPDSMVQQGIRAVCICCREFEFPSGEFCQQIEYHRVDVEDISREPIELFFPEATEFIHSWVSREQAVLVHCRAGVSRSASVVIAYLMTHHNFSLHDAFFLVRSHRSVVTPNLGFMEKLGEYEEKLRGTDPTIDINKYLSWYQTAERAAVPDLKPD
eukprot:TRINITY_DN79673_c0_g1_i1.p1 TRINITY_DN79673_c0_g1~~TRINITY_DN79673_c0_g1_i1.p1  ORF type:complete len:359 (+),score=84.00 TRINITY_DN79673_c0_g1_i1:51-1127(+)